jgi:drug/metabolite transporter (DMT)-like permease
MAGMNADQVSIVSKVLAFSLASVSMLLVNKAAVKACPNTTLLMLSQNSLTLLIMWGYARCSVKIKDFGHFKSWTPCAIIFCLNIYSSSQALQTVTVQTFSVFRNVNTLVTAFLEYITMGTSLEIASLLSIAMVIFGSIVYAWNDLDFNVQGYSWCIIHICSMACYSILVKKTNDSLNLTAQEMSLYNNLISLPVFLLVLVATKAENLSSRLLDPFLDIETAPILYMSGVVAFTISVSAFWVQKAISPTAFILLNNANKIPALLLSHLFFADLLNWPMVVGLSLSLAGACLYSLAARKLIRLSALVRGPGGRTLRAALVALALLVAALAIGRGTTRHFALRAAPRVRTAAVTRVKYDRALCTGLGDRLSVLLSVAALARAADLECLTYWCEGGGGEGGMGWSQWWAFECC